MADTDKSGRVWMEIAIGEEEEVAAEHEAYARGIEFVTTKGAMFGVDPEAELTEADIELLEEMYAMDPEWSGKGEGRFTPPGEWVVGRMEFELDDAKTPKTAQNFRVLCEGSKAKRSYVGAPFHRIVDGFIAQGGDYTRKDGSGGDSIWGKKFKDEKPGLKGKHTERGILSMANSGKNSNTSQFFITLAPAPQCDGKHVVFGKLVSGFDVLDKIASCASSSGTPTTPVVITAAGSYS